MKEAQISKTQFSMLIISSITATGHLIITSLIFERAAKDSWLSLLFATVPGLIIIAILSTLSYKYPKHSLVDLTQIILSKPLGKLMNLLYFFYFFTITSITIKLLMDFITTSFMPITPEIAILFPFLILCSLTLYLGIEGIARVNEFFLPFLLLAGVTASLLSMPTKEYYKLLPILEDGLSPVLLGSIPLIGLFSELVIIGMIQGSVNVKGNPWKRNFIVFFVISIMFIGPLTGPPAVFEYSVLRELSYPTFTQIAYIKIDILENLQPIAIFLWVIGSFGKVCIFYYATIKSLESFWEKVTYKKLIIPIGITISLVAIWLFPTLNSIKNYLITFHIYLGIGLSIVVPTLLLILKRPIKNKV